MSRYAIIVDPVSTGQEYAEAFRAAGRLPVAVLSGPRPATVFLPTWHPENFEHIHHYAGDVDRLAEELKRYEPTFVIPGAETGVELADQLVDRLVPGTGNVSGLSSARRDKWAMAQALARAGVPHLRQLRSADPEEIRGWLRETGLADRPLVFKPPKSMGTDNIHLVPAGADWRAAFDAIVGQPNVEELINDAALVQEYADGTEYLVDSYSVDGTHALVDVCRYIKNSRGDRIGIYHRIDFLEPDHAEVLALWPYIQRVLDAVGIRNGCGHAEVMLTPAGPRLLEVAARPSGGGHQMVSELATGDNHIQRTVAHRVRGEFKPSFELVQHLRGVFISAPRRGWWRNPELFAELETLKSFHWIRVLRDPGEIVPATEDLFTCLAWIILLHSDERTLDEDYERVLELEGKIDIEPVD